MRGVNRFVYLTRHSNGYRFANMKYGERLKMAREHAGLTQQQLADACNIRHQWPASIRNIPPNKPYSFALFANGSGKKLRFAVEANDVRVWKTR